MSQEITTAFVKQYANNVFHLSQQKGSRLQEAVRKEMQKGESKFFERLGSVTAILKSGRHSDTPQLDTPHSRRRVTLNDYIYADMIDEADKLRMLIDPAGPYTEAAVWALGRSKDDVIISAAFGNAYSGVDGATTVALPNSQKLAANDGISAATNLNILALRRCKQKFDENEVDPSIPRYIACHSSQIQALLGTTEVSSSDYNTVKALVRGEVDTFMGFKFIQLQRLPTQSGTLAIDLATGAVGSGGGDADGYRQVLAWAQDGIVLSTAQDVKTRVDERSDKNYSTQVFAEMGIGATRLEEEKVVQILCLES